MIIMKNKITVVITAYNIASPIKMCLNELYHQTFEDFNILVIDDHSADNTRTVIEEYRKKFSGRLTAVFCEENSGSPGAARNIALDSGKVTGDYVIFLDGDDNVEADLLARLYEAAVLENADIVCCGYNRVNSLTGREYSVEMNNFYTDRITSAKNAEYIPLINTSLWNKLIRSECISDSRFCPVRIGEDACFLLEIYGRVSKIIFIRDVLIHYNVSENSLMSGVEVNEVKKLSEKLLRIYGSCRNENFKPALLLSVFIHVGISACVRVYQGRKANISEHIRWTKKYFDNNFPRWYRSEAFKISFLKKLGIKGLALKVCVYLYRMRLFRIFLFLYSFMIEKLGIDVKW